MACCPGRFSLDRLAHSLEHESLGPSRYGGLLQWLGRRGGIVAFNIGLEPMLSSLHPLWLPGAAYASVSCHALFQLACRGA
jgi:hypothetical protein